MLFSCKNQFAFLVFTAKEAHLNYISTCLSLHTRFSFNSVFNAWFKFLEVLERTYTVDRAFTCCYVQKTESHKSVIVCFAVQFGGIRKRVATKRPYWNADEHESSRGKH